MVATARKMTSVYVTAHAADQFRERAKGVGWSSYEARDITNAVAMGIERAIAAGAYEDVVDEGRPTRIVPLCAFLAHPEDLYAVVRVNREVSADPDNLDELGACVVVTVLDATVADRNRRTKWERPVKLGDVVPATFAEVEVSEPESDAVVPDPDPPVVEASDPEWFLHYRTEGGAGDWETEYLGDRGDLNERLAELADAGVTPDRLVVSRRVRTRVRIEVAE